MRLTVLLGCLIALPLAACQKQEDADLKKQEPPVFEREVSAMRLYVFDCGHFEIADMNAYDSSGAQNGKPGSLVNTCFMVRHPKGDLVWEAGIPDKIESAPDGVVSGGYKMTLPKTLKGQLDRIGVPPRAVEYFAVADFNADHVGNANLFKDSTFILSERARDAMFGADAKKDAANYASYADLEATKKATFADSYDVFGDGSAIVISMPGPKPGHAALFINLPHTGPLLLSGDLFYTQEGRANRAIPTFNNDAAATRQSFDAFEQIADQGGARVIVEHDPDDFEKLPRAPAYLD
ncbi:MAG: N-acyl homoserine lactonase family protein [Parvularculaceae bacterium]